jgi:2'-5' RNA ligase
MKHLVIAYPKLSEAGLRRIEESRMKYDPLYLTVRPHFTLIFPLENTTDKEFTDRILTRLAGSTTIHFTLDRATAHQDLMDDSYCLFLVPEEGATELTRLYHSLNDDLITGRQGVSIPFLPHITIGRTRDKNACDAMALEWNLASGTLKGLIDSVDIVRYENGKVISLVNIPLQLPAAG